MKHNRTSARIFKPLKDVSATLPRIKAEQVRTALGADAAAVSRVESALSPLSLFAVRAELARRLQSNGGRPSLAGTTRRAKIPLSDQEWLDLEKLAAALASPDFAPTAGQVASVLLTASLHQAVSQITP